MVGGLDGESSFISRSMLLPLPAQQPIVAHGSHDNPGCQRAAHRGDRWRTCETGPTHLCDRSTRCCGSFADLNTPPRAPVPDRLSPDELTRLRGLLAATDI